jgi:hypothetical protein
MDKARDALRDLSEASEREEPVEEPAGDGSEETSGEDRPAHD